MEITELLKELDKLAIPINKYAITSSGPLGIRGIREINDVDIIVYPEIWDDLSKKYSIHKENNFETIYIGNIQILGNGSWFTDPIFGKVEEQIDNAELFNGHRFVKLKTILEIKKHKTRPKDVEDVKLISQYFKTSKK